MTASRIAARGLAVGLLHACLLGGVPAVASPAAPGDLPSARDVVVRGRSDLADALRIAARPSWEGAVPRDVLLVVDVTPYTAQWGDVLVEALFDVEVHGGAAASWRVAPLGGRAGDAVGRPSLLASQLAEVLAHETPVVSTLDALSRTLQSFGARDGVVVYLADWHFEDDDDLEGLLGALRGRGRTLSVVGSEAAAGRAWNDGFAGFEAALSGAGPYVEGIGRNPFGGGSADEPWHGGDTAYPHAPWRFAQPEWETEFGVPLGAEGGRAGARAPGGGGALEDLRERLREKVPEERAFARHPLPSGWGPYGLMRLAAATGGRYVLWSWNPGGRTNVTYDYARCDLFPPDLRSRAAIRADLPSRPLAAALVHAWHTASERRVGTVTVTPPLSDSLRGAREMEAANVNTQPPWAWRSAEDRDDFVRRVGPAIGGLDEALGELDRAIAATPARADDVDLRYLADAHLLAHALRAQRFGLGEALAVARQVPDDAWDGGRVVALRPVRFLGTGNDPERVRALCTPRAEAALGERLVEERRHVLERYAGTPFGETAARNEIDSYEVGEIRGMSRDPTDIGRGPAESDPTPPPATPPTHGGPGGGSGGSGGSSTGGGR